jgi:hypothetical protein
MSEVIRFTNLPCVVANLPCSRPTENGFGPACFKVRGGGGLTRLLGSGQALEAHTSRANTKPMMPHKHRKALMFLCIGVPNVAHLC